MANLAARALRSTSRQLCTAPRARPGSSSTKELSVGDLTRTRAFLGFQNRATHPASYRYLLGSLAGHNIIDPEETLYAMRKVMHFLKKVSFRGGSMLFVSSQPQLARITRVIGQQTQQPYLSKRWIPGLLTNWEVSRQQVAKAINLNPIAQKAGRLRAVDVQRSIDYRGVEHMQRPPDVVVVLDGTRLHGEPSSLNIPVVGVVDTDSSQDGIDYPIPANRNSLRFYHTLAHMLVRSIREGTQLRLDLEEYRLEDHSDDEEDQRELEPRGRGRGGRGGPRGRGGFR